MKATFLTLLLTAPLALAQGPLTPPGAPAATMKTLAQIEARTPIPNPSMATPPFLITQSGSYYLIGNVEVTSGDGILIHASNVTLDLNGFALISTSTTPSAGNAITLGPDVSGIEIKNGRIQGNTTRTFNGPKPWDASFAPAGWKNGIVDSNTNPSSSVLLSHLTIDQCAEIGILLTGKGASLSHLTASNNASGGIVAEMGTVAHATALANGLTGIAAAAVTHSIANRNGLYGIISPGSISHCVSNENSFYGIYAPSGNIMASTASSNGNSGIVVASGSVSSSTANSNAGSGIYAIGGTVTDSSAKSNESDGIYAFQGSVTNCSASNNAISGIAATQGSVSHSTALNNTINGIDASGGTITNCRATGNQQVGIQAGPGVVAHCTASGNDAGGGFYDKQIDVSAAPNGQRIGCIPATE